MLPLFVNDFTWHCHQFYLALLGKKPDDLIFVHSREVGTEDFQEFFRKSLIFIPFVRRLLEGEARPELLGNLFASPSIFLFTQLILLLYSYKFTFSLQ